MYSRRFGEPIPDTPLEFPPMIQMGLNAALDAVVERPDLIPIGSLTSQVIPRLYADSAWVSWQSFDIAGTDLDIEIDLERGPDPLDWVQVAVLDALDDGIRVKRSVEAGVLAESIRIPTHMIDNAIDKMSSPRVAPTIQSEIVSTWKNLSGHIDADSLEIAGDFTLPNTLKELL